MNIAIQNIHLLPNLFGLGIHNYALELVRRGFVRHLYFSERDVARALRAVRAYLHNRPHGIDWSNVEIVFSPRTLRSTCDILLNFNSHTGANDFTPAVRRFEGIKVWHASDYFWNEPASAVNRRFEAFGVDYVLGYARHDRHCAYFQKSFPKFAGKVIPVPFGFAPRFAVTTAFSERIARCVGLGAVNPLRPLEYPIQNFRESADFYPDEAWMHRFRRKLLLNRHRMSDVFDSMFPEFPRIKDFSYDLVAKMNAYKMVTTCESIFCFPPAKAYEGPACGAVLVCADHGCFRDVGFVDGENCVMYRRDDVDDFADKVRYYVGNDIELSRIQESGTTFVRSRFSHRAVAEYLFKALSALRGQNAA